MDEKKAKQRLSILILLNVDSLYKKPLIRLFKSNHIAFKKIKNKDLTVSDKFKTLAGKTKLL